MRKTNMDEDKSHVPKKSPIVGTVVAGFPSPAEQYLEPPLDINNYLNTNKPSTFLMRVTGQSMRDAAILEGDVIVVDRALEPRNGDIIVAAIDGEFTVKYYKRDAAGVSLLPANPDFPVLRLTEEQTLDYFGKVVGVVRRYGKQQ